MMLGLGLGLGLSQSLRASFVPKNVAGCQLWLRADLGVTGTSTITSWADQSGVGDANRNATASGALRPALNAANADFDGQPTIDFSASMQLKTGAWSVAQSDPLTFFIVAKDNTLGVSNIYLIDSIAGGQCALISASGQMEWYAGSFGGIGDDTLAAFAMVGIFNGSSSKQAFNAKTLASATGPGTNGFTGMSVGNYQGGGTFAGTSIAELAVFAGALSAGDAASLQQYAGARYGLVIGD
jgi:hypothetical protein